MITLAEIQACTAFREISERIHRLANEAGVKIKGYHDPELPLLRTLRPSAQDRAVAALETYADTLDTSDLDDSVAEQRALWKAIKVFGLVPPEDLFDRLHAEAAIEMYDLEGRQIWRNFACMEVCSYTLEEIFCIELFDRYRRTPEFNAECQGKVASFLSDPASFEICDPHIAPHQLIETQSSERLILEVHHQLFSKLRGRDGSLRAWLVMSKARILGQDEQALPHARELPANDSPGLHLV